MDRDLEEGWELQGGMGTPGRDGSPWRGMGILGDEWGPLGGVRELQRMGTTGSDKDCEEGWRAQGGFGTLERNPRKDRDFCEGHGPCGAMGTHKERGAQKGRRPQGGTETPGNDGDPKEGRAIPAPVPHTMGWLLPVPLEARPACPHKPPQAGHSRGAGFGFHHPSSCSTFPFPTPSHHPEPSGCRGAARGVQRGHTRRDTAV